VLTVFCVLTLTSGRALAIGWDKDDFIITGAPNFPQYIGIFDHDLTFKGYLDANFLGVQGMDFDAQGRLVAVSSINPEVRVYNSDGTRAGGFTNTSGQMAATGDLKVAPNGDYLLATDGLTGGVREFSPTGQFLRQFGSGTVSSVAVVQGNRLWVGGYDTTVRFFDFDTAQQVGSFTAAGQITNYSMQYGPATNTVLITDYDRDAGGVYERDLAGSLLHAYHVPHRQIPCDGATWGAGGDVYATHHSYAPSYPDIIQWTASGTVVQERAVWPVEITTVRILWAGAVPEPGSAAFVLAGLLVGSRQLRRKRPGAEKGAALIFLPCPPAPIAGGWKTGQL
jgi:hypothetical protein